MDIAEIESSVVGALARIQGALTMAQLEEQELALLGRNGTINRWTQTLKSIADKDHKRELGKAVNEAKLRIDSALSQRKKNLLSQRSNDIDVTVPGIKKNLGSLHIVTKAIEEISEIFAKIGFYRMSYREVEWEYYAFDALNMTPDHPARDDFETFFVSGASDKKYGRMIMSPHTSSGQVREMIRRGKPPIRMINIARCYRPNWDVTHTPMFHQFEGLCIDTDITIRHLKGAIAHFAHEFYGYDANIRLRPYHFQFTEPSFEVDITCTVCKGTGKVGDAKCRICKSGWLELGGAGMVHPNVLKAGNIDPALYSGWAFGFGIERVYMMKGNLELDDIRKLYSGELDLFIQP